MAINDVAGCIMYEIFFVNFWVIILCPLKPKNIKILKNLKPKKTF